MASRANIAGHPIHPMLVPLPIGLFVFSFVCDLIATWGSGDATWRTVALYTMAGGIIGALLAAIFGLIDLLGLSPSKAKQLAIWHMGINLAVVVLYAINLWLRIGSDPTARLPLVLSFIGILLLVVSGWLGGEMVYVHGVASARERETRA